MPDAYASGSDAAVLGTAEAGHHELRQGSIPSAAKWRGFLATLRTTEAPQLRPLTRKITGKVKFSPSSATSGGGIGTGSDFRTIASAASSKATSPDPLTMLAESTCPLRSSAKLTRISALFCERSE